jgi:hypothetical protein
MDTKRCSRCGEQLPLTMFRRHAQSPQGYVSYCKACMALSVDVPSNHKQCKKCGEIKPLREFHKKVESPDGYRNHCKLCRSQSEGIGYKKSAPEGFRYCSKCGELKPATQAYFYFNAQHSDNLNSACIDCEHQQYAEKRSTILIKRRKDYNENKDSINQQRREAYAQDPEKVLSSHRAWDRRNPEKVRNQHKNYYMRNHEHIRRGVSEYQRDNRERVRHWQKRRYYRDLLDSRAKGRAIAKRRNERQAALPLQFDYDDWQYALEYFDHCCAICGHKSENHRILAMDHWIPVSDPREDNLGTVPENIIPLCHGIGGCNNEKHNRDAKQWLIRKLGEEAGLTKLAEIEAYFQHLREHKS